MINISKVQLLQQLQLWGEHKISNQQLQDWMIIHYDPPEVEVGTGESEWISEAMNIIMNEYELAKIDKFKAEGYQYALIFLDCNEDNFYQRKHQFIHDGFSD